MCVNNWVMSISQNSFKREISRNVLSIVQGTGLLESLTNDDMIDMIAI